MVKVTIEDIHRYGGGGLLQKYYGNSPSVALQNIYPQHNWMIWKFSVIPRGYWKKLVENVEEQKKIIEWLNQKLYITKADDWYRVSMNQVNRHLRVENFKLLALMLQSTYQEHQWDINRFSKHSKTKSTQRKLLLAMQQLFSRTKYFSFLKFF